MHTFVLPTNEWRSTKKGLRLKKVFWDSQTILLFILTSKIVILPPKVWKTTHYVSSFYNCHSDWLMAFKIRLGNYKNDSTYSFCWQDDMLEICTSGSKINLGSSISTRETLAYPKTCSENTWKMLDTILWVNLELVNIRIFRGSSL